jgi:ATP-dependent DNA helicase DinG
MAVAATHAALLMAQGAGRLVRASGDRGVVAVLDQRLATARYGSYLKASLPDFWYTTDPGQVRRSLAAIDEKARMTEESAPEPADDSAEPEDA